VLRSNENGNCVFLGKHGCTVHPDRPLACRIYPLARWISADGEESFGHLAPHPQTAGVYGRSGTVREYLDDQGVQPFFEIGDQYGALYAKMLALLVRLDSKELDRRQERRDAADMLPAGALASLWVDIDASVGPAEASGDLSDTVDRHIRTIEDWLHGLEVVHLSEQ
jgi:Fe-S-cluster containining protein